MSKKTFMQGAIVLAAAGVIIKALGAVFKIPLANMIGDTGMGYYQTAYTIYVMFLVLSNSGVPVAVSRMVSERVAVGRMRDAHKVFRVSFVLLLFTGLASSLFCFCGTDFLLDRFPGMGNAAYAVKAIAPALLIVPLMAAYRGYFQGKQNMRPTANSQVTEQFFRVVTGLCLAWYMLPQGEQFAAAGAAVGAAAGAAAGLLTVVAIYALSGGRRSAERAEHAAEARARRNEAAGSGEGADGTSARGLRVSESARGILLRICLIAAPITVGAAIMPIMNFIDLAVITNRLPGLGWAAEDVRMAYGQLSGFVNPLINLPQILTQSVAMSLVPAVAAAYKQEDIAFLRHNIQLGLRTAIIIGLPCAFGMMTLSEPIMLFLFPAVREAAISAAPFLFILSFGVIFLSAVQTLTGVLQGVGRQMIPVRNLCLGAVLKIVITWTLIAIPSVNVKGAAVGTVAAYILAAVLNLAAVRRHTGARFDIGLTCVKPLVAALVMSAAVFGVYTALHALMGGNAVPVTVSVAVGAIVYAAGLFLGGAVTEDELLLLPKGRYLVKVSYFFKRKH
ncbi:MAG: polysaccharide biosynthesis protein [Clostridiales Family XIII bacterium]|jgi:stage V sporulation protein B|nr:polysaccharide biosynthesis protein [Clostridiales Family XIII bacterium]